MIKEKYITLDDFNLIYMEPKIDKDSIDNINEIAILPNTIFYKRPCISSHESSYFSSDGINNRKLSDINFSIMKNIKNIEFENVVFYSCIFYNLDLEYIEFNRCTFDRTVFVDTDFKLCQFNQCHFEDSSIYNCRFSKSTIDRSSFSNAYIESNDFNDKNKVLFNDYGFLDKDNNIDIIGDTSSHIQENLLNRIHMICPEEGAFIGWKKAFYHDGSYIKAKPAIVKLQIMKSSLRSSGQGRKCRCSKAKVLEITDIEGNKLPDNISVWSWVNCGFTYTVGKIVTSDGFDKNRWNECSDGIHFFMTKQEAIEYEFY